MLIIAIDTNVLLDNDDESCWSLFLKCRNLITGTGRKQNFCLGIDDQGAIQDEYFRSAKVQGRLQRKPPSETLLWQIWKRIIDTDRNSIKSLKCSLPPNLLRDVRALGCGNSIERELIGIGYNNADNQDVLVVYHGAENAFIPRVYPQKLDIELREKGLGKNMLPVEEALDVIDTRRAKKSFQHQHDLQNFLNLSEYRDDSGVFSEKEDLECKCPTPDPEHGGERFLKDSLLRAIAEAACGLLNKNGGWILVGVQNDGLIIGFKPKDDPSGCTRVSDESIDLTLQTIHKEIRRIRPSPAALVSVEHVPISNGQIVVAIHVAPAKRIRLYKNRILVRIGSATYNVTELLNQNNPSATALMEAEKEFLLQILRREDIDLSSLEIKDKESSDT
jgi:hypothetical protein